MGGVESGECDGELVSHSVSESSGLLALPIVHLATYGIGTACPLTHLHRNTHTADHNSMLVFNLYDHH